MSLSDMTFMIPVKLESPDRARNLSMVIPYLAKHCMGAKVIIYEADTESKQAVIDSICAPVHGAIDVEHRFELLQPGDAFHRTKYLNKMLVTVDTPFVANYDCDIVLPSRVYQLVADKLADGVDLVYPYGYNCWDTRQVKDVDSIAPAFKRLLDTRAFHRMFKGRAMSGHCCFFRTASYIFMGGESELFVSWGPEDHERRHRAVKLGLEVVNLPHSAVYHLEHARTADSGRDNPHFQRADHLWGLLQHAPAQEYAAYANKLRADLEAHSHGRRS